MDTDDDPKNIPFRVGGSISGHVVMGSNNVIEAPKPVNDKGTFLPMARNALFTGRQATLTELAQALTGEKSAASACAISGMGGMGKSQLALEFAYRSAGEFVSVHWLNLADPTQLEAEIAACGRLMGIDYPQQPEQVANTLRVWAGNGPRLLVLDNYEAAADALQRLAPLLNLPSVRLLITTRRADFPPELGLRVYNLEVFSPAESLAFLRRLVESDEEEIPDLEALAESLGHLPLALHLAGHYLRETGITPAEYMQELGETLAHESMQAEWFHEIGIASPTAHDQSLLGTFNLSWQKLKDEQAQTVYKIAGYLAPNTPIPLEIFAAVLGLEEKDRALKHALRQLQMLGLFTVRDGLPVIHALLAAYARHLNGTQQELLEKLADRLSIIAKQANEQVDQTGNLTWFAPLQAHTLVSAEYAETHGLQDAANLYSNLGYNLQIIADYPGARAALEHALKIDEAALGKEHPKVATDVNNLGGVLRDLGDLDGARAAFERALEIDEAAWGKEHPKVAIRVNNLGIVLQALSDLDGARAAFERAIRIDEDAFGKEHPNVATDVSNLGGVLQELGDLGGARAAFERALKIDEAALGPAHPNVANHINNLGLVLQDLGDPDGARAAYERALKIDEAAFGPAHPKVARDVMNLGTVLQAQGEKEQARTCYRRALAIFEQFLPAGHTHIETAEKWLKSVEE